MFPFAQLPSDLCKLVIGTWLENTVTVISDLDIAFCSRENRPHYLSWISGLILKCHESALTSKTIVLGCSSRVRFVKWLVHRRLSLHSLTIKPYFLVKDDFLSYVAEIHPQVLLKAADLTMSCSAQIVDTAVSTCAHILRSLTHVSSISVVHYQEHHHSYLPWKHLPNGEGVKSLKLQCVMEGPIVIDLCSLHLNQHLPNLTHLEFQGINLDFVDIVKACAQCLHLATLEITAEESIGQTVPPEDSWSSYALLPRLDTLKLHYLLCTPENDRLVLLLLSRCPSLKALTIDGTDLTMGTTQLIITDIVPKLCQLEWFHVSTGFTIFAETQRQRLFGECVHNTETTLANSQDVLIYFAQLFGQIPMTRLRLDIGQVSINMQSDLQVPSTELWVSTINTLTNLTKLSCEYVVLPAQPDLWATLLSCPTLEDLVLRECANVYESFTLGLAHCSANNLVSKVRRLFLIQAKDDVTVHASLCPLLTAVFPGLVLLRFRLICTEVMLMDLLCHLPSLRYFSARAESSDKPDWFLPTMAAPLWQSLAKQSRCHVWRLYLQDLSVDWSHLQRMVDSLGHSLQELVLVLPIEKTQNEVWWQKLTVVNETPAWREYLHQRRFRVIPRDDFNR